VSGAPAETTAALVRRLDAALAARERLRTRPLRATIGALAEAARRFRADETLAIALPPVARLSTPMIATVLPAAAEALDPAAMTELVEQAWGAGAAARPPGAGPALVAHVLASNVPALALPAIALGCLAGAALVVKSGRDDPLSAPAFQGALAAVDPALAATVVTTYWPGGDRERQDAVLGHADVVVVTGGDRALAALAGGVRGRLLAHGPRWSVALVGRDGARDTEAIAGAVARDIGAHDQRGCLSPHAVYVEGDAAAVARCLAEALERLAAHLPPGPATVDERAVLRLRRAEAEWEPGATVLEGPGGTVILYREPAAFHPTCGQRTVRVHPLASVAALPALLPPDTVECVGVAAADTGALISALRTRGVARLCPVGRMQRPRLTWPRGQQPPLGALLGPSPSCELEVEP